MHLTEAAVNDTKGKQKINKKKTCFVAFCLVSFLSVSTLEDCKDFKGATLGTISSNGFHNT